MWVLLPTLTHSPSSSSQMRSLCQVPTSRVNKAPISFPEKRLRLLACLSPQELLSHPPWAACERSPFPQQPFLLQRHRHPSALCLAAHTRSPWLSSPSPWLFIFSLLPIAFLHLLQDLGLEFLQSVYQGCPAEEDRKDPPRRITPTPIIVSLRGS